MMKYFLEYILLKTNGYNPCYFINFNEEYLYRKINTFPNTFGANLISNTIFKISILYELKIFKYFHTKTYVKSKRKFIFLFQKQLYNKFYKL